jgi:hypothetical protein
MEINTEFPMTLSRLANRLFMDYCRERVKETELRGWYFDAWDFIERLAKQD